jgi:tetratricopeptide (TPR) repeat protein
LTLALTLALSWPVIASAATVSSPSDPGATTHCAGPDAQLRKGNVEAAMDSYSALLRTDNLQCAQDGIVRAQGRKERAKRLCREGARLRQAGSTGASNRRYVQALRANADSDCAQAGIASNDSGSRSVEDWLSLAGKVPAAAATLVLGLIAFLTIAYLAVTRFVHRPSIVVRRFEDGAVNSKVGGAVASLLEERLSELKQSSEYTRSGGLDLDLVIADVEIFADDEDLAEALGKASDVPQLQTAAVALNRIDHIRRQQRLAVGGELLPPGKDGPGIAIALYERNILQARGSLWERTATGWLDPTNANGANGDLSDAGDTPTSGADAFAADGSGASDGDPSPYYHLAGAAAAWAQHAAARAIDARVDALTSSGESFALVSTGLQHHRVGDLASAARCYTRALDYDIDNVAALANLASAFRDAGQSMLSLQLLARAQRALEHRHVGA